MKNKNEHDLTAGRLEAYRAWLEREEKSGATIEKYLRALGRFRAWLEGREVTKELAAGWKKHLTEEGYAPATVNTCLSALNGLFRFLGWEECRVRFLRVQRQMFRDAGRELTRREYQRLVAAAGTQGREELALVMETICAAGIRVSELSYITVEAAGAGKAEISLKGKIRAILLPARLCRKLLKYAGRKKIAFGPIFRAESGGPLDRRRIWRDMKRLCAAAGVAPRKVFPHNLRHLFATEFYRATRDIARLADVLGHSSVETTRIYLLTSGEEHRKQLDGLGLVS